MKKKESSARVSVSASLVTQGQRKFYALTMPSHILAQVSAVTTREEDPIEGFQRVLSSERARQIADYIDKGGVIPNSVILSAQPEAELTYTRTKRSIQFNIVPRAFLILDGQHRVWGYQLAKTELRVPVVVFNDLTRKEEAQLFIDINTKQRPVPTELLLDIKKLVESETDVEKLCGAVFDRFNSDPASPLLGRLTSSKAASGKISRVTFYAALKSVLSMFEGRDLDFIYDALSAYWLSVSQALSAKGCEREVAKPIVFRALFAFFPAIAQRVQDKFNGEYTAEHFTELVSPVFDAAKKSWFVSPRSISELASNLDGSLRAAVRL